MSKTDQDPKVLCEWWDGEFGLHVRLRRPRKNLVIEVKADWNERWTPFFNWPNMTVEMMYEMMSTGARILAEKLDHHVAGWTMGYGGNAKP